MKAIHWFRGVLAISSLVTAACGGSDEEPGGGSGTDPVDCGTHANDGQSVPEMAGVGAMPAAAGGTIVDGTYHLTGWEIYPPGSVDAYLRKQTWVIANGTLRSVSQNDSDPERRNGGTFTTSGTTMTLNVSCPQTGTISTEYTATPTSISFLQMDAVDGNEIHIYTKE